MCQEPTSSPAELVQHMKSHGLKLYQCTWCVLGADNEAELLTHVSIMHPTKQPQAYLRIITNKVCLVSAFFLFTNLGGNASVAR